MKKIILILLFLILCLNIYSNDFKKIDTFNMTINEKRNINNKLKEKKYVLKSILPDIILQEIISPKVNQGEKHLYKNNKKIVYIPMFDQKIEEDYSQEENYIIKLIKDLKEVDFDKHENGEVVFDNKIIKIDIESLTIEEIVYNETEKVVFENYTMTKEGISFPFFIKVYDGENVISELIIESIDINVEFSETEFDI